MSMPRHTMALVLAAGLTPVASAQFVNWETPHVSPITVTPDGTTLALTNLPDNRIEVYDITSGLPVHIGSVPVGLDPVAVAARTDTELWVANHISDSVSIIDLATMNVSRTLATGDEPCDIVFAGTPTRAFVSISQENRVEVFDPADLDAAPISLPIAGEDPRDLETDGTRVFAAIFESGNKTTILSESETSSSRNPYPGDQNPPPNDGASFFPPMAAGLPTPPPVSLIVRQSPDNAWRDDNNGDWSASVGWGLHDHDTAIIDADSLSVTYATGLMNANMALAVRTDGMVTVVGTDCTNEIRFEPNLAGTFARVLMGMFDPTSPNVTSVVDLNPHLDYATVTLPQPDRDRSIGDPRAVAWTADGTAAYIAGMGSNNVIVADVSGTRLARIEVGEGPTGLVLDAARDRLYVVNKFDASLSVVDTVTNTEIDRVPFHDATPDVIKDGRPFLYDTHRTSGLGQASCASCHIDGRMDQLAWDLGDPEGAMKDFNQICNFGIPILDQQCEDWHPMKGPMTTQTLIGIIGTAPFHWRADREDLEEFNGTFVGLLADDTALSAPEMAAFKAFIEHTTFPPNPYREIDGSLRTSLFNGGNPANGSNVFDTALSDGGALTCVQCHARPTGTNQQLTSANALQETQSLKVPQLRNMHEKTGFDASDPSNNRGFGFIHDGSLDNLVHFLELPVFTLSAQQRVDLEAFVFSFATDTFAGVGVQTTVRDGGAIPPTQLALLNQMESLADTQAVGLVVKGTVDGLQRGYAYRDGTSAFQSDRASETVSSAALRALASPGTELTYTLVPFGSEDRIGIDRDGDGFNDSDEHAVCSASDDPSDFPGSATSPDQNGDLTVDVLDLLTFLAAWFDGLADYDGSGETDVLDLLAYLAVWFPCAS